jgi:hypothetical protein
MGINMVENTTLFSETQKFRQYWLILILLTPSAITFYGAYQQLILGIPFGDNPGSDSMVALFAVVFGFFFPVLILSMNLKTEVRYDGLYVRFFPFHLKFKRFEFDEIASYNMVTYNALRDYGGWGIRYGRKGKAYNVSGNGGIMLEFKNGKNLMIGSHDPHEFLYALNKATRTA